MYAVYIMNINYTLADFRKNLRQAFNEADNGRTVLVERYGHTYQLSSLAGTPDAQGVYPGAQHDTHEDDGTPIAEPVLEEPVQRPVKTVVKTRPTCKHGKTEYCQSCGYAPLFPYAEKD